MQVLESKNNPAALQANIRRAINRACGLRGKRSNQPGSRSGVVAVESPGMRRIIARPSWVARPSAAPQVSTPLGNTVRANDVFGNCRLAQTHPAPSPGVGMYAAAPTKQ